MPAGQELQWDNKKEFTLGKTLPEAYKVWAERLANNDDVKTVSELLDRYLLEHVPTKSYKAQQSWWFGDTAITTSIRRYASR